MPAGRPSEYYPEVCDEIIEYFDVDITQEREITRTSKSGEVSTFTEIVAGDLPTIAGFAAKIGVCKATIHNWADQHPEFLDALSRAKSIQEHMLVTNGLQGRYQPTFAGLAAMNIAGWGQKNEHTGSGGGPIQFILPGKPDEEG